MNQKFLHKQDSFEPYLVASSVEKFVEWFRFYRFNDNARSSRAARYSFWRQRNREHYKEMTE